MDIRSIRVLYGCWAIERPSGDNMLKVAFEYSRDIGNATSITCGCRTNDIDAKGIDIDPMTICFRYQVRKVACLLGTIVIIYELRSEPTRYYSTS